MLLLAAILGVGALLGWGLGGALRNLALIQVTWWPAYPASLALQAIPVPQLGGELGLFLPFAVLALTYVVLIAVTAINWRLHGFLVILVGLLLNAVPIFINQGMPVSGQAVLEAGGSVDHLPRERGEKHHLATAEDELQFLGDVVPVRPPFRTAVSVGDVLMFSGAAWFLCASMLGRPERRSRTAAVRPRPARSSTMWGTLR